MDAVMNDDDDDDDIETQLQDTKPEFNSVIMSNDECIMRATSMTPYTYFNKTGYRLNIILNPIDDRYKEKFHDDLRTLIKYAEEESRATINRDWYSTTNILNVFVDQSWVTCEETEIHINQNPERALVISPHRTTIVCLELGCKLLTNDDNTNRIVVPSIFAIDTLKVNRSVAIFSNRSKCGNVEPATDEEYKRFGCKTMIKYVYADKTFTRIPYLW
jgi:hypothetical protein